MAKKKEKPISRPGVYFFDPDGTRQKKLSAKVFYELDRSPRAQMDFMSHFMTYKADGKKYMSKEDAMETLFQYNVGELEDLFIALREALGESAFPND